MKEFTILAHNIKNGNCLVITTIMAATRKEAMRIATHDYYRYLEPNEQLVVANESQYKEFWEDKVRRTDELTSESDF